MGGAVSAGRTNNELVDKLIRAKFLRSLHVQRIFRAVDRAHYFLPEEKDHAYIDLAWKNGHLHISAPCIYCDVIEGLKLKPGHSFLNLGSGTGYLSTLAGLILGVSGINHGIEVHQDVVDYARERLEEFVMQSPAIDEFDFCEPKFVVGNCLCLPPNTQLYDRVYCGAACPKEHEEYVKRLIKVGGILVMPLEDYLVRIKRVSENEWTSKQLTQVSFTTLLCPNTDDIVEIPEIVPASLQELCRSSIRKSLHITIAQENPNLVETLMKFVNSKTKRRLELNRTETFCIALDDEDSDPEDFNRLHNLDLDSGSREMNALLRLVLSMGNRSMDIPQNELVTISNSNSSNVSSIDEQDYSIDGSNFSSDNEDHVMSNDNVVDEDNAVTDSNAMNDDNTMIDDNIMFEKVARSYNESTYPENVDMSDSIKEVPSTSRPRSEAYNLVKKMFDDEDNDSSVDMEDMCIPQTTSNQQKSDSSDSKKLKADSGIVGDASTTAEYGSSLNDNSDLMDTNSGEEFEDDESQNSRSNWDQVTWFARKRHISGRDNHSDDVDGSTDSDSDVHPVTQSKIKRHSPLPPNPYDEDRLKLSELMKDKVHTLPLPPPLIKFLNMNRGS